MMPMIQAKAWITSVRVGPPIVRSRAALTTAVTGWWFANTWSQPGIDSTGTNADDAKTSGARIGNEAAWAVSASGAMRPTIANTHESEYANAMTSATQAISPKMFVAI